MLRSPCLLSFLLILQVPPHLWAFAHAVTSAWNASLSLSFAQLTLPHHWILNVTSSGKFSLIPLEWVRPSVKRGHKVCKSTHDTKAFPMPPPDLLSNHSVLHTSAAAVVASWLLLRHAKWIPLQHPCTCCSLYLERSSPFYLSCLSSKVITSERPS